MRKWCGVGVGLQVQEYFSFLQIIPCMARSNGGSVGHVSLRLMITTEATIILTLIWPGFRILFR